MCSRLRESPEHSSTPVILLTGVAKRISDSKYPLDGVLRADAEQYLEKPVKPEELLETVARLLK
jgi:CheY-like chemotaxis protein